jgi:acyl-CoA synthetase (NDP forming)
MAYLVSSQLAIKIREEKEEKGIFKDVAKVNPASLDLVFNPRTVALIGASENELKSGGMFLNSFIDCGLKSELFLVNPRDGEIRSLKVYPSVLDIPKKIDLAIIAIPASVTPKAVEDCSKKGVKFIVVHTAGFGEMGSEGKKTEEKMMQVARRGGSRIIGPNCMGIYCPETGFNTVVPYIGGLTEESGDVAHVAQSGWVCEHVMLIGYERGLRFSKVLSIGNQSDLTFLDFLEYLGSDPKTSIISAYLEGVKKGRDLIDVAKKISRKKPIIIWKAGRTGAGTKAVTSHTGSLAGDPTIHETAFKQAGIITAQGIEELLDLLIAFKSPYLPKGNKVGIIVGAGGAGVAAADACENLGLKVANLPERTRLELKDLLRGVIPPFSGVSNPVDTVWLPLGQAPSIHPQMIEIMSRAVDAFMIFSYEPYGENYLSVLAKTREKIRKPIVCVPPHPTKGLDTTPWTKRGFPVYPTPKRATRALAALAQRHVFLEKLKK